MAFLLYATWACQGRLLLDVELRRRGKSKGRLIPYFIDFLVRSTKTGEYKKSEDGRFPPTEWTSYILLTPRSGDLYRLCYGMFYLVPDCSIVFYF